MTLFYSENLQAWEHGAKILIIAGEDDRQIHPKWHTFFCGSVPQKFKSNVELHCYPGAGHLIEPPYSPHTRAITPGRKRMSSIDFIPEQFHGINHKLKDLFVNKTCNEYL